MHGRKTAVESLPSHGKDNGIEDAEFPGSTKMIPKATQLLFLILCSFAFALYLSAGLMVRTGVHGTTSFNPYMVRLVMAATYFFIAFLSRNHCSKIQKIAVAAIVIEFFYLLFAFVIPRIIAPDSLSSLVFMFETARILGEVSNVLFTLLFLYFFSLFPSKYSGFCIPLAFAGSRGIFLVVQALPESLLLLIKPCLHVIAPLLLIICLAQMGLFSRDPATTQEISSPKSKQAFFFANSSRELILILSGVIVFPFLYALIGEISSNKKVNPILFRYIAEITGIIALVILTSIMYLFRGKSRSFEATFVVVFPIFAIAMLLLPFFWGNEVFVSGFMIRCGYLLYYTLLVCFIARQVCQKPQKVFLYFGIILGTWFIATVCGRAAGYGLHTYLGVDDQTIAYVSLVAILILTMGLLIFFMTTHRFTKEAPAADQDVIQEKQTDELFAQQCQRFSCRFGLSVRESEILMVM